MLIRFLFAAVRSSKIGGYKERTAASSLLNDFDGEFDLVGLFVGIEFDEGLDVAVHDGSTGFDKVLLFGLFFRVLSPYEKMQPLKL